MQFETVAGSSNARDLDQFNKKVQLLLDAGYELLGRITMIGDGYFVQVLVKNESK